ncbi:MAG: hypothetical protein OER93_02720 [Thermoleophilia bacterium]|nr:hypothetical protein [Thermoleophilia bacterium]
MRYIPESWAPEHTAPLPEEPAEDSPVNVEVERQADDWGAIDCAGQPFARVAFVDGVRRRDTWVVAEGKDSDCRGLMASWAAGAVVSDGTAEITGVQVERGVFCNAEGAKDVTPIPGFTYRQRSAAGDSAEELTMEAHKAMLDLELKVAARLPVSDLLVLDGPLRGTVKDDQLTVGYVKTHYRAYGNELVSDAVAALSAGQRTPVFMISRLGTSRLTWYLRLPGERAHRWADIARCEMPPDPPEGDLTEIANRVSRTLLAFASKSHQDPRAPQNLLPIGALERELHHRLGDRGLFLRALRQVASQTP